MIASNIAVCTPDQAGYLGNEVILYNYDDIDRAATDANILGQRVSAVELLPGKSYYTCRLRNRNNRLRQQYRLGEYLNDFDNNLELAIPSIELATRDWLEELRYNRYVALVAINDYTQNYWEMIGYELGLAVVAIERDSNGDLSNGYFVTLSSDSEFKESKQSYIVQSTPLPVIAPPAKVGYHTISVPLTAGTTYTFAHGYVMTNVTCEAFTSIAGVEFVGVLIPSIANPSTHYTIIPSQDYNASELTIRVIGQ